MKKYIFAVRDRQTVTFGDLMTVRHKGEAERAFMDAIRNPNSMLHKHSVDFDLYELGVFDDESGEAQFKVPEQVMLGSTVELALKK